LEKVTQLNEEIEKLEVHSDLPNQPDLAFVEAMLIEMRMELYG